MDEMLPEGLEIENEGGVCKKVVKSVINVWNSVRFYHKVLGCG
jgi:hypothetical protein